MKRILVGPKSFFVVVILLINSHGASSFRSSGLVTTKTRMNQRASSTRSALRATSERREFLAMAGLAVAGWTSTSPAFAEEDLTTQLFNEDGSLKEGTGIESEAKFRSVKFAWDGSSASTSSEYQINVDGLATKKLEGEAEPVSISYDVPLKWKGPNENGNGQDLYQDLTVEGQDVKALTKITIYQAPGQVKQQQLEKASTIGVAKALKVLPELDALQQADLVGGRVRTVGSSKQKMFDFDMAVAPKTCGDSPENLGLGFCPFDTIYLLTATIVNDRLYVFALECDKDQWKRSNSDLRKVRSTFEVQA